MIVLKIISAILIGLISVFSIAIFINIIKWFIELYAYLTSEFCHNTFKKPKVFDSFGYHILSILIAIYYLIQQFI